MLSVEGTMIPDPLTLSTWWHSKADGVRLWQPVYISDVPNYLLASKDTISSSKYLNGYKIGKTWILCIRLAKGGFFTIQYQLFLNTAYCLVLHWKKPQEIACVFTFPVLLGKIYYILIMYVIFYQKVNVNWFSFCSDHY